MLSGDAPSIARVLLRPSTYNEQVIYGARMHRWSELFIPTLREAPAGGEATSYKLLLRAGYARPLASGMFSYLFLGQRSINKIVALVREEMDKIGQEFCCPGLQARGIQGGSGRGSETGGNLVRAKEPRGGRTQCRRGHD